MSSYWLPRVTARSDVPSEVVARAYHALRLLPEHVADQLWPVWVAVRSEFPWNEECDTYGQAWRDTGGYWNQANRCAVINGAWCSTQPLMDAVVLHELGHALSLYVLPRPHRTAEFRAAWKAGCQRVRREFPEHYRRHRGLGVFCIHWTRGIQEVWAEGFAWTLGAREATHPDFGRVYAECLDMVAATLETDSTP